jgi:GH3 auxin-responsive promoter
MNSLAPLPPAKLPKRQSPRMFSPTRSLLTVGVSFLTLRAARKLKDGRDAVPAQNRALARLCGQLASTVYGSLHGIEAGMSYAQFQAKVPLQTYEGLSPFIERMKAGESDILWPGHCSFYAVSSGTTAGRTKYLPITEAMLEHFRKAGLDSLLYYTARVGHSGVFRGKHLFLGGATTLAQLDECKQRTAYAGDLSGITALNMPDWVEKHLYEPGQAIAQVADWPTKLQAIAERTWNRDITLLAGIPSWMLILAETVKARATGPDGVAPANLEAVWPNLECLIHGGVPVGPFVDELRAHIGPKVNFHEVYPASEGFIATQDAAASLGLRLMTDVGLFFEFLPLKDYDPNNLQNLGQRTVSLADAKVGVDYALVLSTPAGLTRYVIGDVVRFISTDIPRLVYVGRTALQLSAFGEHVIEKELTDALLTVCHRHGWSIVNFHVAPLFSDSAIGQRRGRHEWWVELKPNTMETPTGPVLAAELDVELKRLNDDYEAKRNGGGLDTPLVKLVMPGIFEQWLRSKGKWGGQNKTPRCRSDREVADGLALVARFHSEA